MRCQTSPNFSSIRYGNPYRHTLIDFAGDGGLLYALSSSLLFWQDDIGSCRAADMVAGIPESLHRRGSLSLLWPLFQSICVGQFVEILSSSIQGRKILTETGMSVFEHSLAFAEAESMISNQLGFSPFGSYKPGGNKSRDDTGGIPDGIETISKSMLFDRLNAPPEVLLMGLISSFNNLSSQILGTLGIQARFRLISTGIWGLCFMGSFVWGIFSYSDARADTAILRFPAVCIVGFIPHLLIFTCICLCCSVYLIALLLSVFSPPGGLPIPASLVEKFRLAHHNLHATSQLSSIQLSMQDDFYSALLKVGFTVLTVASEAVYLNEGQKVSIGRLTWLEEERYHEIESSGQSGQFTGSEKNNSITQMASGFGWINSRDMSPYSDSRSRTSGYNREKTTEDLKLGANKTRKRMRGDGVGALQRGGRYIMVWEFFTGIFWLMAGIFVMVITRVFDAAGIARRPLWLRRTMPFDKVLVDQDAVAQTAQPQSLEFWLLSDEGVLSLPENDDVDVEAETKRKISMSNGQWSEEEERVLDSSLYDWWTHGGWWGERDESGDYQEPIQDDDTTSVISASTCHDEIECASDGSEENGCQTPTQRKPYPGSRSSSPVMDHTLNTLHLARLLSPQDHADREEAQILAHHLRNDHVVTRSRYRHSQSFEKAHLLTSTRHRPSTFPQGNLTPVEEAELLKHLIITRRADRAAKEHMPSTWRDGAEDLGAGGPQCVVCQSSPRTILAWPCRCLSLCEDCRVSLAMNNFGTCVCCRQEVVGFSRLYVP